MAGRPGSRRIDQRNAQCLGELGGERTGALAGGVSCEIRLRQENVASAGKLQADLALAGIAAPCRLDADGAHAAARGNLPAAMAHPAARVDAERGVAAPPAPDGQAGRIAGNREETEADPKRGRSRAKE